MGRTGPNLRGQSLQRYGGSHHPRDPGPTFLGRFSFDELLEGENGKWLKHRLMHHSYPKLRLWYVLSFMLREQEEIVPRFKEVAEAIKRMTEVLPHGTERVVAAKEIFTSLLYGLTERLEDHPLRQERDENIKYLSI